MRDDLLPNPCICCRFSRMLHDLGQRVIRLCRPSLRYVIPRDRTRPSRCVGAVGAGAHHHSEQHDIPLMVQEQRDTNKYGFLLAAELVCVCSLRSLSIDSDCKYSSSQIWFPVIRTNPQCDLSCHFACVSAKKLPSKYVLEVRQHVDTSCVATRGTFLFLRSALCSVTV